MKSRGYSPKDLMILQMARQNRTDDMSEYLSIELEGDESVLKSFQEDGLIEFIKSGSKKDSLFKKARISKKGEKLLSDIQTFKVEEEDIKVYEWLKSKYIEMDKEVGSEKKGLESCAWFRRESNISKNNLVILCRTFMADENRMQYSLVLEHMFWKKSHDYDKDRKLENSKLWLYYEKHREYFDQEFLKHTVQ